MTKIFGQENFQEKIIVKKTLAVLTVSMTVRVIGFVLLQIYSDKTADFLLNYTSYYEATLLLMWTIIDLLPATFLFWIHYRNFMSFEGHDYLST